MPGVLSFNYQCGLNRPVGKMAFLENSDVMTFNSGDDIILNGDDFDSASHLFQDTAESDCDLPDNENPVDLIEYLDSSDIDSDYGQHQNNCSDGCSQCVRSTRHRGISRQDPFLGTVFFDHHRAVLRPEIINLTLAQLAGPIKEEPESEPMQQDTKVFSAWHTPDTKGLSDWSTSKSEESDFMASLVSKTNIGWHVYDDDSSNENFPDTPPSAPSTTNTGDDSDVDVDVDIETVTDGSRSGDSCGYITQASVPSSPISPERSWKLKSGPSTSKEKTVAARSSKQFSALKFSSSTSSAENRTNHSSLCGQKRNLPKDKKSTSKSQSQQVYSHVLCNSNSVNFHDYAMSPGACAYQTSTETGRPTVLSKRIYKRHITVDPAGKDKQHHHNQLERNRRQKLADLFTDLRDEVPKITNHIKASKVLILKEAAMYIRDLQKLEKLQDDDISKELRKKQLLKHQLHQLQSQPSGGNCVK